MTLIYNNLLIVKKRILSACKKFSKEENKITIVAVSKMQSVNNIKKAISFGQVHFGENYIQEAIKKIDKLSNNKMIKWHFIGKIQSNKIKIISKNFSWCHSIDKFDTIKKLHNARPVSIKPLNVLIQINISKEINKSGIEEKYLNTFAEEILNHSRLRLKGIMFIPKIEKNIDKKIIIFKKIAKIMNNFKKQYSNYDTLSLGMSDDLELAISVGSNMLRIGTSIFGMRK